MRIRTLVLGAVAAITALPVGAASASPDHTQTLRNICEAQGGTWVPRPGWWRARCQGVNSEGADDGTRAAFMICTMQMDGQFTKGVADYGTNWICF
jgi:hypothetical protein